MNIDGEPLGRFLQFWRPIDDPTSDAVEFTEAWGEEVMARLDGLPDELLELATDGYERMAADDEATRSSVNTRAGGLLLVVGVMASATSFVASATAGALIWLVAATVLAQATLVYFAVGTAWLAIRAQQVGTWTRPLVKTSELSTPRSYNVRRPWELYVSARRNRYAIETQVGYLRAAQHFALITVALVGIVAVLATTAAATKRNDSSTAGGGAPSPTASTAPALPTNSLRVSVPPPSLTNVTQPPPASSVPASHIP